MYTPVDYWIILYKLQISEGFRHKYPAVSPAAAFWGVQHFGASIARAGKSFLPVTSTSEIRQVTSFASQNKRLSVCQPRWPSISKRTATTSPESPPSEPVSTTPYSALTVGVPLEIFPGEDRVAITPQNVALLLKKGVSLVLIERGAGERAQLLDHAYEKAGATMVDRDAVWSHEYIPIILESFCTASKMGCGRHVSWSMKSRTPCARFMTIMDITLQLSLSTD
ncbi:unnamed protein product [Penicillium viridicatum]